LGTGHGFGERFHFADDAGPVARKDGAMDEEYLFWDNLSFMKQIGLA
jgi:hypothetical protein